MTEPVLVQRTDAIAEVLLNRPKQFNALDMDLLDALAHHLMGLSMDDAVRAVVISGEGRAFCAGGDLRWVNDFTLGRARAFHELAGRFHHAITEVRRMLKPVIAAVNGVAAGGGFSLALACDFRVMSESATLIQAYTSSGLCLDGGGSFTLPRLVGLARALEIVAFDKPISSEQAMAWGLVTKVVPDGAAREEAVRMARELAGGSVHSFGQAKKLLTDSYHTAFEAHIEHERTAMCACASHADGREGVQAFLEKRKPKYPTEG